MPKSDALPFGKRANSTNSRAGSVDQRSKGANIQLFGKIFALKNANNCFVNKLALILLFFATIYILLKINKNVNTFTTNIITTTLVLV